MDRHDLPGVTAEDVAQAHARDREVSGKHDVHFLTYWFDADLGAAFCLARAPGAENVSAAHAEAHGLIPNDIIGVSEEAVLGFLGKIREPADSTEVTSSFRTILFTDLEGSTELAEKLEPSVYIELLREHDVIIRRALLASGGREVKHTGDGIMAAFDDIASSLACGLAIQEGFRARPVTDGAPDYQVRVGMAAGEPVDHNDDLFGSTVNLARRICDAAVPGEVWVSDVVREQGVSAGFEFSDGETVALRGFAEPVLVFKLVGRE